MDSLEKYYRVYVTINLDAVYNNVVNLKKNLKPETGVIAVIKTDGYGHGAIPIAYTIDPLVEAYAVATIDEAENLRKHKITKPIYILGYTHCSQFDRAIWNDIRLTVYNYEDAACFYQYSERAGRQGLIHLKVDTGMSRIGFSDTPESVETIKKIAKLKHLEIEGIFTHFATADEKDKTKTYLQLQRFQSFVEKLEKEGINIPVKHCSNSAAMMELPEANMDSVRAGIAMYGLYPSGEVDKTKAELMPALELKSHIIHVKELGPGVEIGYGGTYTTGKNTVVATVPVGYGDGYRRSLSNRGYVLVRGKRAPILGRVCMDQFMADVSHIENVRTGDVVTLIGMDGDDRITAEEVAQMAGETFNYEIVCDLGKRIPRVFCRNGEIVCMKDYFDDKYDVNM